MVPLAADQNKWEYPWSDLPLWAPTTDDYFMQVSNAKSLATGFSYTPLSTTLDDCLNWLKKNGNPDIKFGQGEEAIGLERARELGVIESILSNSKIPSK